MWRNRSLNDAANCPSRAACASDSGVDRRLMSSNASHGHLALPGLRERPRSAVTQKFRDPVVSSSRPSPETKRSLPIAMWPTRSREGRCRPGGLPVLPSPLCLLAAPQVAPAIMKRSLAALLGRVFCPSGQGRPCAVPGLPVADRGQAGGPLGSPYIMQNQPVIMSLAAWPHWVAVDRRFTLFDRGQLFGVQVRGRDAHCWCCRPTSSFYPHRC